MLTDTIPLKDVIRISYIIGSGCLISKRDEVCNWADENQSLFADLLLIKCYRLCSI
jgi:hypothetical protein